jgi:sec-independent protein translocase protein TatC
MARKARVSADTEMPFLDHLEELRHRLFWIAGAILVGIIASYVVLSQKRIDLIGFLSEPIKPYLRNGSLIYTHPGTSFKIILNAAIYSGLLLATPMIGYQLWGFFSPALHRHEKRVIVPTLFAMVFLFVCGVALCYFTVMPFTLRFFDSFESTSLKPMIEATQYFDFAFSMMLAFGLAFELPIAILLLSVLAVAVVVSVGLMVRDIRRMHARKMELADEEMSAAGVSPAAMGFYGSTFSR